MITIYQSILNWSEVWALLIPLSILFLYPRQPTILKPVIVYIWIAFALNLIGDLNVVFKAYFPSWFQSNNPLYNLHSIIRFTCFSYFFMSLNQVSYKVVKKVLPYLSLLAIIIIFSIDDFFYTNNLSGNLLTVEAYLLLVYCMLYYLSQLNDDVPEIKSGPDFWIATGLSIYVVINFFLFLFYIPMIKQNDHLADRMWDVHNYAYIILCLFIAKAFYGTTSN